MWKQEPAETMYSREIAIRGNKNKMLYLISFVNINTNAQCCALVNEFMQGMKY